MKKIKTLLFILWFFSISGVFAQNLSWRVVNPRIIRVSSFDRFEFEVEVKANVSGYYYADLQATFNTTAAPSGQYPFLNVGAVIRKGLSADGTKYDGIAISINSSGRLSMYVSSSHTFNPGLEIISDYFDLMPTTWSTMATFQIRLNTSYTGEVSSMVWSTVDMDNNNFYQDPTSSSLFLFPTPYSYGNNGFQNLFLGRIYCNSLGWSQVGNSSNNQWVDWTTAVNTSVFDTNQAGGHVSLAIAGALAAKLRIHAAGLAGTDVFGGRLEIAPGGQLTCTDNTEINLPRGLWISSTNLGTGSFIDNGITYNGSASALAERYLVPDQWHGYYPPFSAIGTNAFTNYYMKYYREWDTHSWRYVIDNSHTDSALNNTNKLGFMMWSSSLTTNNTPVRPRGQFNSGTVSMPVTRTNGFIPWQATTDFDGWNFVGNPYPSAIDLTLLTYNLVGTNVWFWDNTFGNYTIYPSTTGLPYGTHASKYAAGSQGFFVHTTGASTLQFTNAARVQNTEGYLKEDGVDFIKLKATTSANSYADLCTVHFQENSMLGFDQNIDAEKLGGLTEAPQIYFPIENNKNVTINVLPWTGINQVVPMSFSFSIGASTTITASNMESFRSGTRIFLEDKKEGRTQELTVNPAYTCTASPGDNPDRFVLHFYNPTFGTEDKTFAGMQIYSFEAYVYVRNTVKGTTKGIFQIYDLLGRKVFQGNLKDLELNKFLPGVNEGYFMVRVVTDANSYTQKVYLK